MDSFQKTIDLDIRLGRGDVCQIIDCGTERPFDPTSPDQLEPLLNEAMSIMRGQGVYTICDVEYLNNEELQLNQGLPIYGPLQKFLNPASRVAVFVVTVGDRLEKLTHEYLNDGKPQVGLVMQAISSAAADAVVEALIDHLQWNELEPNEGLTPPACPGHCGIRLEEQKKLFSILDAKPIGVRLLSDLVMAPKISLSGLIGIGDQQAIIQHGLPCQYCDLQTCRLGQNHRRLN